MGAIARTAGWSMAGSNAINLTCGVLSPSPLGLMLGSIAGYTTGMWSLAIQSKLILQLKEIGWLGLNPRDFWGLARKYKRLALIQAPSTLFNSLGIYLPGVLAAPFCGAYFAGQLFMGMKIIALPSSLIGVALSQVFYSGAAAIARERPEDLARFFNKVFIRGTAGSVLILLVGQAARWAIPIALGEKWKMASEIAPWLSLGEAVGFSVSALSSIPNVVGRLYGQFVINATRAVAVFLLFFLNQRLGFSGMILVKCYTLVMVLNYIGCFFLYRYQVNLVSRTGKTGWKKTN
jgi:O-antigen/teichoic acid export membrane protein